MRLDVPSESSARQKIHMKNQALFSSKDRSKNLKCRLLQFLFFAVRVKGKLQPVRCASLSSDISYSHFIILQLQSNFNGSNTFGTMKICSRQGYFEPLGVYYRARSGGIIGISFRFSST